MGYKIKIDGYHDRIDFNKNDKELTFWLSHGFEEIPFMIYLDELKQVIEKCESLIDKENSKCA